MIKKLLTSHTSKYKTISYVLFSTGLFLLITGLTVLNSDKLYYKELKQQIKYFETNNIIDEKNVSDLIYRTTFANKAYHKELSKSVNRYKNYSDLANRINTIYINSILEGTTTDKEIQVIEKQYNQLDKKYQVRLKPSIEDIKKQKENINIVEDNINKLFDDENKTIVKENITIEIITDCYKRLELIPQENIKNKCRTYLDYAKNIVSEREKAKIEAAWKKLNVPYISQNKNNILNGCEAAALLMALKYKGYLQNMTLTEFVKYMPISKNNDPYEGFTHDMYSLQPLTIPHWIAPPPLAKFGRDISGNQNIIDATNYTLDALDKEIDNNNPVIIYIIAKFNEPKETVEGAPRNLHVMLLTGYNKLTNEHYIVDPWTHDDGRTSWTVSKELLENRYNYVGKKAVIVR